MKNFYRNGRDTGSQNQQKYSSDASLQGRNRSAIYRATPVEDVRATNPKSPNARKYLDQSKTERSWLKEALDRCENLGALAANWDSYGAEAPNAKARYWAGEALIKVHRLGVAAPRIAASVENGIGLTLRKGSKSATIEFFNDGDIVAVRSDGAAMPVAWDVATDPKSIEAALYQMRDFVYG